MDLSASVKLQPSEICVTWPRFWPLQVMDLQVKANLTAIKANEKSMYDPIQL